MCALSHGKTIVLYVPRRWAPVLATFPVALSSCLWLLFTNFIDAWQQLLQTLRNKLERKRATISYKVIEKSHQIPF
ncbi:hypothetical protein RRG08_046916 [Elysia crispata]|uniref:Uncharacterized protein n=1 Tax=Elysia crispata TaxID=231223 RepID=A0AAE0ZJB0_9GAST|nr:hypothetical protein RRG08_046916 [Elysia crispata]